MAARDAALSGWTVSTATAIATATTLYVASLNGLTTARRPDLALGSPVRFNAVSANNPLTVYVVLDDGSLYTGSITAFSATTAGDETGPGSITITPGITGGRSVPLRTPIYTIDRSYMVRVGGGMSVDSIGADDLVRLVDLRSAVARLQNMNVPEHADGRFHLHIDPTSQTQFFSDPEFQRLMTSLPDYYAYKQFALGEILGCIVNRNSECPQSTTVDGAMTPAFSQDDPFAGDLWAGNVLTGTPVHYALLTGQGSVVEYFSDLNALVTEAGVQGRVGTPQITNNGIEVNTDKIQLIIRAPQNRLQDMVSTTWKFIGDWAMRTDATTGDAARMKRGVCIQHGE